MKIYDMHLHSYNKDICPQKLLASLEEAGIYGCCVFSNPPGGKQGDRHRL